MSLVALALGLCRVETLGDSHRAHHLLPTVIDAPVLTARQLHDLVLDSNALDRNGSKGADRTEEYRECE